MGRNNGGGCSICRLLNGLVTLAFLGAGGYLIWHFLGQPSVDDVKNAFGGLGDFSDVLGNFSNVDFGDFFDQDPFVSDNTTTAWKTNGEGGLELTMLNALDETWQDEFTLAVSDWENGDPDALTLSVTRGEVDYACKEKDGVQKVCSGNFGDTGWLGINIISYTSSSRVVQSSVAKMNEYYLRNADNAKRQYTMCHEIGHGFGLPHTDESFTNPSLGNCMDYTNRPQDNMHPDETNYKRLASVYGTVNRRRRRLGKHNDIESRRALSEDLQQEYEAAVAEIEQLPVRRILSQSGVSEYTEWELVHEHPRGSSYERRLGDDHYIQAHLLHDFEDLN